MHAELAKRRKHLALKRLRKVYRYDPVLFVKECIEWPPDQFLTPYQEDILRLLIKKKRESVRSPHGAGKTTTAALSILWFSIVMNAVCEEDGYDWKVPTTASSWQQLDKFLWPEVHKWGRRLKWDRIGRDKPYDPRTELQQMSLKLSRGEAFAVASDKPELMEGAHADRMLFVFDESKAIPSPTWDAMEGAFSGTGENLVLSISTPGEPIGRFYNIQTAQKGYLDWHVRPVKLEEAIACGRISKEWAEQRADQWGEESAVYQNRVKGEFATADESAVIRLDHLEICHENWRKWRASVSNQEYNYPKDLTALGIDIAGRGPDKNAYAYRKEYVIMKVEEDREKDTMKTATRATDILKECGGVGVVDIVAIGAGPFDRMRELKAEVAPFHPQKKTRATDISGELQFKDLRTAACWRLRELINPARGLNVCIPYDEELTAELVSIRRKGTHTSRVIAVESKDEIIKRLGRSPDKADAVLQAFALELITGYGNIELWGGNPDPETAEQERRELEEMLDKEEEAELNRLVLAQGGYFPGSDWA